MIILLEFENIDRKGTNWKLLEGDEKRIALPFELGSKEQAGSVVETDKQLCGAGPVQGKSLEKVRLSLEHACIGLYYTSRRLERRKRSW